MRGGRRAGARPLVLLAQNETGYRNLMRLVSRAYLETEPGRDAAGGARRASRAHAEGLIALTGGAGGPDRRGCSPTARTAAADALLGASRAGFPGRLYVELQRHGLAGEARIEAGADRSRLRGTTLPLVATNDVLSSPTPGMYEAHDALLCIAEGRLLSRTRPPAR